ncbi:Kelch repeat-containing protein [Sphingobacterium olei]|nr:hypothetical protein [Sphingobacterium olei]
MNCTSSMQHAELSQIEWENGSSLPGDNTGHSHKGLAGPIVGVSNGILIVAGGANFPDKMPWEGGVKWYHDRVYAYKINDGNIKLFKVSLLPATVAYTANYSANNTVYAVGGEDIKGATSTAMTYKWNTDRNELESSFLPNLPLPLTNGSLVVYDDKLYFIGGENANLVSNKIYVLDLQALANGWIEFLDLPLPLTHTVALINNDKLYLFGGRKRNEGAVSTLYNQSYRIDLVEKNVVGIAALPHGIAAGTGFVDYKGRMILIGGDKGETFHRVEKLILAIHKEPDPLKKDSLNNEKADVQSAHPGFTKDVWQYGEEDNKWYSLSPLPEGSPVTTTAVMFQDRVFIPSGEIKAGVRTSNILVGNIN